MPRDNLTAERIVVTTYKEIIRWLGEASPESRPQCAHRMNAVIAPLTGAGVARLQPASGRRRSRRYWVHVRC
jgi:hypothetical protein